MSAATEQAKWVVRLQMRERPPGSFQDAHEDPQRWGRSVDVGRALAGLSREISRGGEEERREAAWELGWLCDRRAVSPLIRALGDRVSEVRVAAASGLAGYYSLPLWAADPLVAALGDTSVLVRSKAAKALGSTRNEQALGPLTAALKDPARDVRYAAAGSLRSLGAQGLMSEDAARGLVDTLAEDDAHLVYAAYWALAAQGGTKWEHARAAFRWSAHGGHVWREMAGS